MFLSLGDGFQHKEFNYYNFKTINLSYIFVLTLLNSNDFNHSLFYDERLYSKFLTFTNVMIFALDGSSYQIII